MTNQHGKKDFFDYLNPYTRKYVKPLIDWIFKHKLYSIIIVAVILLLFFLINIIFDVVKHTIIISFLILLGGVSTIYQRFLKVRLGIELIMFATVLTGFIYGSLIGAIVGVITLALSIAIEGYFSHTRFISFILIALVGFFAHFFNGSATIMTTGIILTICYDLLLIPLTISFFRTRLPTLLIFSSSHIVWNWWIFTKIAPFMLGILT